MKHSKGFTLLEFVVIIVLIGLVGAAVVPNMKLVEVRKLKSIAREIEFDIKAQRTRAINGKADTYGIELYSTEDGNFYGYRMPPEILIGGNLSTVNKREDMSKKMNIEFNAYSKTLGVKQPVSIYFNRYGQMYMKAASIAGVTQDTLISNLNVVITYNDQTITCDFNGKTGSGGILQ